MALGRALRPCFESGLALNPPFPSSLRNPAVCQPGPVPTTRGRAGPRLLVLLPGRCRGRSAASTSCKAGIARSRVAVGARGSSRWVMSAAYLWGAAGRGGRGSGAPRTGSARRCWRHRSLRSSLGSGQLQLEKVSRQYRRVKERVGCQPIHVHRQPKRQNKTCTHDRLWVSDELSGWQNNSETFFEGVGPV